MPAPNTNASDASSPRGEITRLLVKASAGNKAAFDELVPLVYDELHRIASGRLKLENVGHTLTPTALVHDDQRRRPDVANSAGAHSQCVVAVRVPHDQGKGK